MSIDLIGIKSKLVYLSGGGDDCVQLTEVEGLVKEVEKLQAEIRERTICKWCDHNTSDVPEHQKQLVTIHAATGGDLLRELKEYSFFDKGWVVTWIDEEDLKYFFRFEVTMEREWPERKNYEG